MFDKLNFTENRQSNIVLNKAIQRSHGITLNNSCNNIYCFISPSQNEEKLVKEIVNKKKSKILIFGKISDELAGFIGLRLNKNVLELNDINFDHNNIEDNSNLYIEYKNHFLTKRNSLKKRYFYRFDFTDEWNNLGYGAITTNNDLYSISNSVENIDSEIIANIFDNGEKKSVFISLKDFNNASILFVNREVGLIDGLDWCIVEDFLSKYRKDELDCLPLVYDIPNGCEALVSARLDCDQSVINTKPLVELYKKYNIDLSLAIAVGININDKEIEYLNSFFDNGGAILSHSKNHYEFWGENYEIAFNEAKESKEWLEQNIKNIKSLKYAVSPFHSNKPYSMQALKDAGYDGVISGIIHNDPEYLVSTSGIVPFVKGDLVTHSQQCMLHGDCYHRRNNSIEIYKESFKNHYNSKKIFGYLDHPFGKYDYGWNSEKERLEVHREFIEYINSFEGVKWATAVEMLQFVYDKSTVKINIDENDNITLYRESYKSPEQIVVEYKGNIYVC